MVEAVARALASSPPAAAKDSWLVLGLRFVTMTGHPSALFEMGDHARLQILCHAAPGTPLPTLRADLLDRFERLVTSRCVTIFHATRVVFGEGEAIIVVVDFGLEVFIGEYVARVVVEGPLASPVTSAPISVYNSRPFPPFFGRLAFLLFSHGGADRASKIDLRQWSFFGVARDG